MIIRYMSLDGHEVEKEQIEISTQDINKAIVHMQGLGFDTTRINCAGSWALMHKGNERVLVSKD